MNKVIAVAPGDFQSELGCTGDWDPSCLRSWLQDPDGDGIYTFSTKTLPAGTYEGKVAINESWDENYGPGGVPGGANIPFTVSAGDTVNFIYDPVSHVLTINVVTPARTLPWWAACRASWAVQATGIRPALRRSWIWTRATMSGPRASTCRPATGL